jgi:S1-C subfamily serine protease
MVDPTKNLVPKLGILGVDIDKKIAEMLPDLRKKYGIVVAARGGDSAYSGDALQLGDVIYSVNTEPVTTVDALRKILDTFKEDEPLVLQVEREGKLRYLTLTME